MDKTAFTTRRLACAYYFACPGLAYGILTSRLPALKSRTGADDGQIGLLLLCLGLSSLMALLSSNAFIARFGSRKVLRASALVMVIGVCLCCLAGNPLLLGVFCVLTGFGMGLADVSMNTQGIQLEKRWNASCLSSMHAAYSLGGVCGSLTGAAFAAFSLAPIVQAASVLGVYTCLAPWAGARLLKDAGSSEQKSRGRPGLRRVPLFVLLCGGMSMLAYATEGSVAEWGSLLLHESKGASEQVSALVFAMFSLAMVSCRLFGDRLRFLLGDFCLVLTGSLMAFCGLAAVLLSGVPFVCLIGYAFMGIGLSPIVPILFSRAGSYPGVSPREASAVVAILSYSGLLFFPPFLGFLAQREGLPRSLLTILAACALLALGSLALKKGKGRGGSPR